MRTLVARGWRRLRELRTELPLLTLWIAVLAGIEIYGRRARSDVGDAVGVAVLVGLALFTWARHASEPLAVVGRLLRLGRPLGERLSRFRIHLGLDLRGSPPLPRRVPPLLRVALLVAGGACLATGALAPWLPGGLRAVALPVSCSLYVAYLSVLWTLLGGGALILYFIPLIYLGEAMERSRRWRWRRVRLQLWLGMLYLTALVFGASLLPGWVPFAICLVALSAFLALSHLPRGPALYMLWRPAGSDSPPASFHWLVLTTGLYVLYVAGALTLTFVSRGDQLFGTTAGDTPITAILGLTLSWTFCGAFLVEVYHLSSILLLGRLADPAVPSTPRVHVEEAESGLVRRRVRGALEQAGLDVAFPPLLRAPTDVPIRLAREAPGLDPFQPTPWPRPTTLGELGEPALHATLRRRDEILCRRALLRGIERAFKDAKSRRFEKGSGYWIAPHLWFVTHLSRDVDEDVTGMIGRPWRKLIPRPARHHLHVVMQGLELDLVFVEDGIAFRSLKRVLLLLFEHHDIFGGRRLEDERHFSGIPGVRVIVHDYSLEEPFCSTKYPEPDYEDLGRARILHVFRDRGGDVDDALVPADLDWLPAPTEPLLVR